jgi:alpha-ketoglutarate-dependent taurine dioxygenase
MDDFSDWVARGVLTVRLVPDADLSRITVGAYAGLRKRQRVVLLRDGFLEAPAPGARLLRRPGVANVWLDRSEAEILSFASTLGSQVVTQVWEQDVREQDGREQDVRESEEDIGPIEH